MEFEELEVRCVMVATRVHLAIIIEIMRGSMLLETLPDTKGLSATFHGTFEWLLAMFQHVVLVFVDSLKLLTAGLAHAILHPTAKERKATVVGSLAVHFGI